MKLSSHFRRAAVLGLSLLLAAQLGVGACAASAFDAAYYAETNPDVAAACGTDEASLLRHYLSSGQAEGRKPSARGKAGDSLKLTNEQIALVWSPVPLKDLANYKSLKKKMTDEQYQAAYQEAAATKGQPTMILAHTVKGKGVSFMENNAGWHGKAPNDEQFAQAKAELEAAIKELEG